MTNEQIEAGRRWLAPKMATLEEYGASAIEWNEPALLAFLSAYQKMLEVEHSNADWLYAVREAAEIAWLAFIGEGGEGADDE